MAGGAAIVTEAGGVIMDISGESLRKQKLCQTLLLQKKKKKTFERLLSHWMK